MTGFLLSTVFAGAVALSPTPDAWPTAPERALVASTTEVRPGDTLNGIAANEGVSVEDLRRWNPGKIGKDDLIRLGEKLTVMRAPDDLPEEKVEESWIAEVDIKPGDTLGRIAKRLNVSIADLKRWNHLGPNGVIRAGRTLRYMQHGFRPEARSVGSPTHGRLHYGVHLARGRGYRLRFPRNAYTTRPVWRTLHLCTAAMADRFPGTADILIGDISRPSGGRFPPHVSHQSGRDADVGYYLLGNVQNETMYRVGPKDIDFEKTWALMACLIEAQDVVRIYVDRAIQRAMVDYLEKRGDVPAETLDRLFAVRGDGSRNALIQHAPKHDTHFHVRFACDDVDADCSEDKGDVVVHLAPPAAP
ncbi:MAG: penicillin-insensitive murein endopeptidase [Myxococcales bacterium]|nr:penicillin-insensitive murein endopeptidase [Myxococcales bacterium]MCB9733554.1 penicillin-insensitive murein endopeptidase [Deltaproteobacteria bacterium]